MKKYFITGLVILLPVTLTLVVVSFIFNLLTTPFLGISQAILNHYNLLDQGFLFLSAEQLLTFLSQALTLVLLFFITVFLGIVARWFFVHYIIHFWEYIIHRIPLVSTIYKACQDVIKTIFTSQTSAFKQVVMVRFPNAETFTIGLVTRDSLPGLDIDQISGSNLVAVFVPTTPNPTSGFLAIYRREDIVPLDMKVEDAFKYVISCGLIMPPFNKVATVSNGSVFLNPSFDIPAVK